MHKTTVYLPVEVKRALGRAAAARGVSEAELIREAVSAITESEAAPRPTVPLFKSNKPQLAERIEKALEGFGES